MIATSVRKSTRRAVAAVWALVVLAVVSGMSAAAIGHFMGARRQVDSHQNRLQADWLARAGYELAVAGLIADPKKYTGESVALIPKGEIKITVKNDSGENGVYRVECEARYPAGARDAIVKTLHRTLKRVEDKRGVRIETVSLEP